jgi:hypothetical protein
MATETIPLHIFLLAAAGAAMEAHTTTAHNTTAATLAAEAMMTALTLKTRQITLSKSFLYT